MATTAPAGIHFEAEATVGARPEIVWDILTDYINGHPKIIPPRAFSDFVVESGGKGAGTSMRFNFRAAGTTRKMRQVASAPELGRKLVEADVAGPARTTFTLTPLDGGQRTRVHIATDQTIEPGVAGTGARLLAPLIAPILRSIYLEEIQRLDSLAQTWPAPGSSSSI